MKICNKCKTEKDASKFHKDKSHKDGLRGECNSCEYDRRSKFRKSDEGKLHQLDLRFGNGSKEKYIEAWCKQDGYCQICSKSLKFLNTNTHFDHNHITGKFRGLLCASCNTGIGLLRDSPKVLYSATRYLELSLA